MSILNRPVKAIREIMAAPRSTMAFAIKDIKSGEFQAPFFQGTAAAAIRLFKTEVNRDNQGNLMNLYPEDFELYYLGTFNLATGELSPELELIAQGPQLKNGETK